MAQMWHYINFFSNKPAKVTSDFILNYLKKVVMGKEVSVAIKEINEVKSEFNE